MTALWAIMEKMFLWPTIGFNYCDLFDLLQFSKNIIWREHHKITLKSIFINKWGLWVQDTERQLMSSQARNPLSNATHKEREKDHRW